MLLPITSLSPKISVPWNGFTALNSVEIGTWEQRLLATESYLVSGLQMTLPEKGNLVYQFEKLDFSESFSGNRHFLNASFNLDNWKIQSMGSFLNSDASTSTSKFLRNQTQVKYHFKKNWIGGSLKLEDNQEKDKLTNQFSALSQRFTEYGFFAGRGDSTKVFVELGYYKRANDSLQNGIIQRVNNSQTFALRSEINPNQQKRFITFRELSRFGFCGCHQKK